MTSIFEVYLEPYNDIPTTALERREIIREYTADIIRAGYNQTEARTIFRNSGLGINDADFGAIYREIDSRLSDIDWFKFTPLNEQITRDSLKRGNYDFEGDYGFTVGYTSYDPAVDTTAYQEKFYVTDRLGTIEEMLPDIIEDIFEGDSPPLFSELGDITVLRGYINPFTVG